MIDADLLAKAQAELARVAAGGAFNEGFWQNLFDEGGRNQLYRDRSTRAVEVNNARRDYNVAMRSAVTVEEKRAARKLGKRAKVMAGLQRLYARDCRKDPQMIAYTQATKWQSEARDLAVFLHRWNLTVKGMTE